VNTISQPIIIPAYQPGEQLVSVIDRLQELGAARIVVINDGSSLDCDTVFNKISAMSVVHVLEHAENRGKGAALRTGFQYVLDHVAGCGSVVTADADGQHRPDDIIGVQQAAMTYPDRLILGVRQFDGDVPWRSRFGNTMTKTVCRLLFRRRLTDTQTGLRAIPQKMLARLIALKSQRYSFELEMLVFLIREGILLQEVPIRTVYEGNNDTSHFRPVRDSVAIYSTLFRLWLKRKN